MSVADGVLMSCCGFLLAVLWMDLIFDSQVRGARSEQLPEAVLASISDYYRRATTTSRPMSHLIAVVMVILLVALAFQVLSGHDPLWLIVVSAALAAVPILLALIRTVPNAVRLGGRPDGLVAQSQLARSVYREHVLCFAFISTLLVLRLTHVATS
jgi:uncharacterized membrane protein